MMDPMGDMGADSSAVSMDNDLMHNSREVFDPMILHYNMARIERVRAVMGIASGCIAGIAGFTGMEGFVCFLVLHFVVSLAVWGFKMNFNLQAHTKQSWFKYLTDPIQSTGLSFTLFWTLFYGLVYLY